MKDESTCKREIDALQRSMEELKIKKGTVVTLEDDEKEIEVTSGVINIKPAWKMFLSPL